MAITLTTSWQNLSTSPSEYYRGWTSGYTYNYVAMAQARYQVVNGQYQIQMRILMQTDHSGGWNSTNRHYRLRFLNNPGTNGDSTYRQDTHSWMATGPQSYYLYLAGETANPVYKIVNPGTTEAVTWHYDVGGSGTTAIDVSKDVYLPIPPTTYKLYGSVNGQTKKVTKLYGSVNGQTKQITKLYGSVNGQTKRIF